ncbi:hypothetical protein KI688_004684 [Linnemannia hyalina]|uniref:Protein kinase domain-containing protein n=1 Tax=Linnemannia hyalina TaxID=64524 RepID=A0A9P8BNR8_9FUNG|nr:hypothetical protein KI688_004684 [Linnemannia hyalina]
MASILLASTAMPLLFSTASALLFSTATVHSSSAAAVLSSPASTAFLTAATRATLSPATAQSTLIIITPPTGSLLLPELSDHIQSLPRSVTPTRRLLSNSPVPIVRTPGGSGWKLNEPMRHSNKVKAKVTEESGESSSYFVDQVTGERYKKDDTLGEGGFGVVYRVVNNDGKAYALKSFKNDGSGRNFQREINMLDAAGKHDNIVKYFGLVNDPSGKFPPFELCRPLDLFDLIRNQTEVRVGDLGLAERHDLSRGFKPNITTLNHVFLNQLESVLLENEATDGFWAKRATIAQAGVLAMKAATVSMEVGHHQSEAIYQGYLPPQGVVEPDEDEDEDEAEDVDEDGGSADEAKEDFFNAE